MFKVYSIKKKFVVCCVRCCSSMSSWQMPYMDMATCFEVDWWYLNFYPQCNWLMVNAHDPLNLVYLNALRFGSFTTITKPNELDQHCDKKYGIYFPFQWITFNKIHTKMQFWCFKLYMLFSGTFAHTYIEVLSFKLSIQMSNKKGNVRFAIWLVYRAIENFLVKSFTVFFSPYYSEFLCLSEGINFKSSFFRGNSDNQNL